ncbi:putative membrane protein [Rhodopseudomonas rhenobacensis]|uniref:Putative membrane protein n=1 Tax=Rhodopseudomonas rhenobacensis TaxID=87461 RepID=A0A7W7Z8H6_9BRAD|nr:DUF2269 family protein [Rhodopseudomonas rhenobacensis]MBB5049928.1 putative membrane protein [Rhodopseudomonas rhenobacensis]
MYDVLKALHVLGVVLLVGNVTITAYWKVLADRTADPKIVAHAQHGVNAADWIFTLAGIALVMIGGYGAAYVRGLPLFDSVWLVGGQILFAVSGMMWLGILVPLQIRQGRAARNFASLDRIPLSYLRDAQKWLVWGIIATVPLVAATVLMVLKP